MIRRSFFITSTGIVFSFVILALSLISLRTLGINIVWGMQFQQPIFLTIIALVLLIFTMNLFGFFEFKIPAFINSEVLQKLSNNNYSKDFFNGFFATLLATPCSAPFVGTAITAAFTQSAYTMLGIFIFMGIGMASPYLFISLFPNMAKILPKPGLWMNYVRYLLGVLLLGTFFWIFSILTNHLFSSYAINQKFENSAWEDITKIQISDLIQNNEIIFVDITADWCATCQYNKLNVINSKIIQEKFNSYNVIKVRGDWTKQNKEIENFLNQFNRFGIPFNVIFSKDYPKGIILSELLTKKEIIDALDTINKN